MSREIYEEDLNYAMSMVHSILQLIGAWPLPASSPVTAKISYRIRNMVTYFLFSVTMVPSLLYVFLKESNARLKLKMIGPILNSSMQFAKYSILLYRADDIRKSMDMMANDWMNATEEDRQIFQSKAQIGRRLVWMSVIFMFGGGLCYRTIVPILRGKVVTPQNVTIRSLAYPGYFLMINEQLSPFYEIIFVLQFFSGFVAYSVTTGSCGISAFLILHVCSQLRILTRLMRNLADGKEMDDESVQRRLVAIVYRQTEIMRYLKHIESIIQYICFVETMGGTFLTCLAGYCIIMEWESSNGVAILAYSILLFSFSFCVFIFCYIGQLLDDENNNVELTSITIEWYRLPLKRARCLVFVIAMSNNPMKLIAGKMLHMSLATFTDIMKMSMGYLNILRTVE